MSIIKKAFLLLSALLFVSFNALANMGNATEWDVRSTGNDNNGACFDKTVTSPGTDFSTQDSAQIAYTDLVIGGSANQATSAAHPFSSTYPGNCVHIVSGSGCTTGFYMINSVSGTTATFDRNLGTSASTCTANLGGGLATLSAGMTGAAGAVQDGDIVAFWLKNGATYTQTSTLSVNGSNRCSFLVIGYATSHGDNPTSLPTVTTATNTTPLFANSSGGNRSVILENLNLTNTAATRTNLFSFNSNAAAPGIFGLFNCTLSGFSGALDFTPGNNNYWVMVNNVSITGDQGTAVKLSHFSVGNINNSYISGAASSGVSSTASVITITNSLIVNNTGRGVDFQGGGGIYPLSVYNSTIANNTSDGIGLTEANSTNADAVPATIQGNIIYGNGGWGINATSGHNLVSQYNLTHNGWGSNTSGNYPASVQAGPGDVSITANPFVNSGGNNYALNSTAGGGAALKQQGFPGVFIGGSTTGFKDSGAVQSQGASTATVGYPVL